MNVSPRKGSPHIHQELLEKTKTANPSGRRLSLLRGDLFGEFPTTHRRELPFPINGTLPLHCQVARLLSKSFVMLI
jgi:hypothetical protein